MEKWLSRMMAMAGVALAAGCAHGPTAGPGMTADAIAAIRQQGVQPMIATDAELKEQTKGKVVAATTAKVVFAFLGGGQVPLGQRNKMPAGGYTDTAQHATVFTADEALSFQGPVAAMSKALERKFESAGVAVSPQGRFQVMSRASFWGIDYEKLSEADNYRLYYNITTTVYDGDKVVSSAECLGATKEMHDLDAWRADDKALVRKGAAAIGDICADQLLARLGLVSGDIKAAPVGSP